MKCLIIAAGLGSRLATRGSSKPLVQLGGIPLIERVILTILQAGVTDFHIVIGYNGEKVRDYLMSFSRQYPVTIDFIYNDQWEKPNGISVYCAHKKINEPFFLVMSDHLFEVSIVKDFQKEGVVDGEVKLAVDMRISDNPLVDLDDVTKVWTVDGKIIDIGKTIPRYNAFDTGIFLCSPALFQALEVSIADGDASLSGGIRLMANQKKAHIFDIGNRNWIDVDDDDAFERAQKLFALN
ncbi:MAG: NTP transferase domain-containing protein [Acidobacteria bacterium]|jgi:choline kinase|nr:NTP transferase domain-containing protein [Acidobacteriota bacterium]